MIDNQNDETLVLLDPSKLLGFDQMCVLDAQEPDLINALDAVHNKISELPPAPPPP